MPRPAWVPLPPGGCGQAGGPRPPPSHRPEPVAAVEPRERTGRRRARRQRRHRAGRRPRGEARRRTGRCGPRRDPARRRRGARPALRGSRLQRHQPRRTRRSSTMVNDWDARDGMRIGFDVPIPMDDGIVLRADVFAPEQDGEYPVLMTYGPYAKGLHFEDGYPDAWRLMCEDHPDVPAGSTNKYQAWEVVDPEKWVREGYVCIRVDSRGAGRSPGVIDCFSPREVRDLYDCIEW